MFLNRHRLDYWLKANAGSVPFTPTSLFGVGDTGGWWNPADHTTTFQDTAGTVPATSAGDVVQRINDKSGNGNNLLYTSVSPQLPPVLRNSGALWWLEFTVANQTFIQATFTFVNPITVIVAVDVVNYSLNSYVNDGTAPNSLLLFANPGSPTFSLLQSAVACGNDNLTTGTNHVASEVFNGASSSLTIDNGTAATGDPGTDTPAGITFGAKGDGSAGYIDMNWFGAVAIGRTLTAPETANTRTFLGNLAGLSL